MKIIDVFCHILPPRYWRTVMEKTGGAGYMLKRMQGLPALYDLDARFRITDPFEGYVQVISLAAPPIEAIAPPSDSPGLARMANEEMAELVERHQDRFVGFVASLPMNNPEKAVEEAEYAIRHLGARGVQIFTNVNGQPLDQEAYLPLFETLARHDLPIWVHPTRKPAVADYQNEKRSKYDIWWALGWPYETSVFMTRVVFWGLFDRFPNIKIITHHMGGLVPYLEGRIGHGLDSLGTRTDEEEDIRARERLQKRPYDYFRMFYADTALFGSVAATECGLAFFGADRVLFATDFPFDPQGGRLFVKETMQVVQYMTCSPEDKQKIFEGNARKILKLEEVRHGTS